MFGPSRRGIATYSSRRPGFLRGYEITRFPRHPGRRDAYIALPRREIPGNPPHHFFYISSCVPSLSDGILPIPAWLLTIALVGAVAPYGSSREPGPCHHLSAREGHMSSVATQVAAQTSPQSSAPRESIEQKAINTIRTLSIDAVQAANSGHPGTPMAIGRAGRLRHLASAHLPASTRPTRSGPIEIASCSPWATPRCSSTRSST